MLMRASVSNRAVLAVHHPPRTEAFAMISFTGFVGAVTGFNPHIALSEKVPLPRAKPPHTAAMAHTHTHTHTHTHRVGRPA